MDPKYVTRSNNLFQVKRRISVRLSISFITQCNKTIRNEAAKEGAGNILSELPNTVKIIFL